MAWSSGCCAVDRRVLTDADGAARVARCRPPGRAIPSTHPRWGAILWRLTAGGRGWGLLCAVYRPDSVVVVDSLGSLVSVNSIKRNMANAGCKLSWLSTRTTSALF
jgi:hypothetical protein